MRRSTLKLLALIMAFAMVFSTVFSFAEETDENTVVIEESGDDTTEDDTTGDDTAGDDTTEEDTTGDDTTGDDTTGDDTTGDDTAGDDTAGDDTTGDDTTGDDTTGDDTAGEDTTGGDTTGDDTTGDDTTGDDTTEDDTTEDDTPEDAGTISYEGEVGDKVKFSDTDFSSAYKAATGKSFKGFYMTKLPSTTYGVIYYDYDGSDEEKIAKDEKLGISLIDDVSFVAKKEGTVTIPCVLYGATGDPRINGEIKITIEASSKTAGVISLSGYNDDVIEFSGSKFNSMCKTATGKNLDFIKFTIPSTSYGVLYYDYDGSDEAKITKSAKLYYNDDPDISDVSFVPKSTYSGTVTIKYTGEDVTGKEISGTVKIKITDADDEDEDDEDGDVDTVSYTGYNDDEIALDGDDFYEVFEDIDEELINIEFKTVPTTSQGVLYYDYDGSDEEKIAKGDEFNYDDDPDISDITFVPKSSYSGTVSITYKGYYTKTKYIEGKISIKVKDSGGDDDEDEEDGDVDTVSYTGYNDDEIAFDGDDFYEVFDDAGEDFLGLEFKTVPTTSQGVLYYDYDGSDEEKIAKGDKFNYDDDPDISDITFIPKSSYSGTVTITYKGYYAKTKYIEGKISIKVKDSDGDDEDDEDEDSDIKAITVKASQDEEVTINSSEMNSAFKSASGKTLSYVKFSIPSSSQGTLYYDYDGDGEKKVSSSTKYMYSGSTNSLKKVSFVPKKGFKGTATITYTAYGTSGNGYAGTIKITYGSSSSINEKDTTIQYKGVSDAGIKFGVNEFNVASIAVDESAVATVRFGMVAQDAGKLYIYYGLSNQKEILAGTTFYSDKMPSISDVTFVPKEGFKGTARVSYTAQSYDGKVFTGNVEIQVIGKPVETIPQKKFADVAEDSWYKDIVYKVCDAELMKGTGDTTFEPTKAMSVAEAITMAARIHNQAKGGKDSDFVLSGEWYDVYVNYAITNGIIKKEDFDDYNRNATRAEMAYIFCNSVAATELEAINSWVVPDVDKDGRFGAEIYVLYNAGILTGSDSLGTFRPKDNIIRAEAATILARLGKIIDRVKK